MRNRFLLFSFLFFSAFAFSCRTDFEVNEKWKEIDIVYGLLDINDSVHYIKVGKAFLNQDESAYKIAAIEDSLYHNDSLDVRLQEIKNATVQNEIRLQKTYLTNKDSGVFASPGQYLYKTPQGYKINPDATYKVVVKNTSTGVQASAQSEIVGNIKPVFPNPTSSTLTFIRGQVRPVNYFSGKGAKFYDLNIVINYTEYNKADNSKIKDGSIRWPIYTSYQNINLQPNNDIKYNIRGDDFFKTIIDNLEANDKVYRKIGKLDFQITGGGEEIYNYMNVYRPSIGIVQKKPEYTNIENGQGVFSSRNRTVITVPVSSSTVKELVEGAPTRHLNFRQ
ncbi:MAG: hypothetical protein ACXWEY_01370 [Bacteroidia bacterium]